MAIMDRVNVVQAVANHEPNRLEMRKMRRVGPAALAAGLAAGFGGAAAAAGFGGAAATAAEGAAVTAVVGGLAVIPVSAGSGCGAGESAPGFDGSAMRLSLLVMPVVAKRL